MHGEKLVTHEKSLTALCAVFVAMLAYAAAIAAPQRGAGISFETNDDVAAMMIAHGFGLAATTCAMLPLSNVLQGYVVRGLGWRFGVTGYALHLMGALLVAGGAAVGCLTLLNGRPWANGLLVGALLLRPTMQP